MGMKQIKGKNKRNIVLYALSTCGWCRKTKDLLRELSVEYKFVDVDLLEGKERGEIIEEVERWNPQCSFPTIVINNKCIVGYDEQKIRGAIGRELY